MQRLAKYPFYNRVRAEREIKALARAVPEASAERLARMIGTSTDPEQVLHHCATLLEAGRAALLALVESPVGLRSLAAVFSYSRFLSEEVLRNPELLVDLIDGPKLEAPRTAEEFRVLLTAALGAGLPPALDLARFRRRQILRIALRDVLGMASLPEVTGELTALADTLLDVAYERIQEDLETQYGRPAEGGGQARFAVLALGKMGGRELNYSSDIDLMFLYSANGETDGERRLTNKEFFKRAANQLTALLSTYTGEGLCYRVDLRLRPDGSLGEVCLPLEGAKRYYAERARDWELQMMIKARVAAGDRATGRALLEFVEERTYATTLDFTLIEELSQTRERLNEKLAVRQLAKAGPELRGVDVKLDRGGIRDIEFLVQCLQRLHGGHDTWVRHGGTLLALARLQDKGYLSGAEYGKLAQAYQFLRHLEHRLQLEDDRQTHTLPTAKAALDLIARRMPGGGNGEMLLLDLRKHFQNVLEIYQRVVHARSLPAAESTGRQEANVVRALEQSAPALREVLAQAKSERGVRAFEHFLERQAGNPAALERLNREPALARAMLDLFENSPYFAEELIRTPELMQDVARADRPLAGEQPAPADAGELRRWFRREMVRIQSDSIVAARPIFETLERTSNLAEAVIGRAYQIALAEVRAATPPQNPDYVPRDQMWIIALGRLGMREFDMASDADLVFVLGDNDAPEMLFWTRVAKRALDFITAYTGSGVLFAVDTRLRPNGGAGPMVQTESAVKEYFETSAEAWEGLAYMKARAVGGNARGADAFLTELQAVDWQRYGQGGRSRADVRLMRLKLEREQGPSHPLKAGRGGYYDIDFLLMYLRLKSAGVYFKVLNTPERIDVLELMGHLGRDEARFLWGAATFYRALDHGLRVISGHAEGKLPKAESQLEMLAAVLTRWSPIPLTDLSRIRSETRAIFERYFG